MKKLDKPVPPGGTIGIIGGGQLGRMLALAAARLGLKTCIYNDASDAPAFQVTPHAISAAATRATAVSPVQYGSRADLSAAHCRLQRTGRAGR